MVCRAVARIGPGILLFVASLGAEPPGLPDRREIAGGTAATVTDYPFVVFVLGQTTPLRYCSGTLVSDTWVLTAAHCLDGLYDWQIAIVHGYPTYTEVRATSQAVMHPDYDPLTEEGKAYDIGLIEMESPFLSRTAVSVRLAKQAEGIFLQSGTLTTAVGWGADDPATSESMTAAQWSLATCPEALASTDRILCTSRTDTGSVQVGDSGGPLLVRSGDEYVQVGVTYWRNRDGFDLYQNVSAYENWFASVTNAPAQLAVTVDNRTGNSCSITAVPGLLFDSLTPLPDGDERVYVFDDLPVDATLAVQCGDGSTDTDSSGAAPLPAPPPFQPQSVDVALGESGDKVTLMTTEAGGFTLNGEEFRSGGSVTASNGNTYVLTLAEGQWTATLQP